MFVRYRRAPSRLISVTGLILLLLACGSRREEQIREIFICVPSTSLLLTPRSGFKPIRELTNGERVAVLFEKDDWLKVRTVQGEEGWIMRQDTAELDVIDRATKLAVEAGAEQVQYEATLGADANLRIEPDRNAPFPLRLDKGQTVFVMNRSRPAKETVEGTHPAPQFIKVRTADQHAGWVAGWLVQPVIPHELEAYQEERKIGACVELDKVSTGEGEVSQYVWADLSPSADPDVDFDRIRVFTWNKRNASYGTAYVERNLRGTLPITKVALPDGTVQVSIRLLSRDGRSREELYAFKAPYFRKMRANEGLTAQREQGGGTSSVGAR